MRKKVGKIGITITLLLTMLMSNFLFVYESIASSIVYVTNHENIEFSTYFKDEQGNKQETSELTYQNKEKTLYFNINVKKEGYFNGMITLENANFTCVQEQEKNDKISKIESNKIYLNQINAGSNVEIPVKIEMITEDIYDVNLLNRQTDIILEGTYKDNTQQDIKINSQKQVTAKLVKGNESLQANTEVITNKILPVEGEEKRIIQIALDVSYYDYPVKEFNITVPQIGEDTKVVTNLNTMTKIEEVRDTNPTSQKQENKISIHLKNEPNEENKVIWKKSEAERMVVTYLCNKDTSVEALSIKTQIEATLYDETIVRTQENSINITEEKDSIVRTSLTCEEKEIYKGKLYANLDREIKTNTQVSINLAKVTKNISITEAQATWITQEDQEETVNEIYQTTKLKKEELEKVLGEKGTLTIDSIEEGQNRTIVQIDKNSEANDKGEIMIEYPENVTKVQYQLSKVEQEGNFSIQTTKVIKNNEKEVVQMAQKLQNLVSSYYQLRDDLESKSEIHISEIEIPLKESSSQAFLEVNPESLSAITENKGVEIRAILKSDTEACDLYKNPHIQIVLPEEVTNLKINSINKIAGNEFEIEQKESEVEGKKIIDIVLKGEQTEYKKISEQGIILLINCDISFAPTTTSGITTIKMFYTNENRISVEKSSSVFETEKEINLTAPKTLLLTNGIKELAINSTGEEEQKVMEIKQEMANNLYTVEGQFHNHTESKIENIRLKGFFPTNGTLNEKTINNANIALKNGITLDNKENATIYYTANPIATDDIENIENGWKENIDEVSNVIQYLIIIPSMDNSESVKMSYNFQMPEGFDYNQQAYLGYEASYQNTTTNAQEKASATVIKLETGMGPSLEATLSGSVGEEKLSSNSTVKLGEVIRYCLRLKNNGSEDLENVQATATIPKGSVYVEPSDNFEYTGASYYQEIEKETQEFTIPLLKKGETITKEYEVKVKEATIGTTIKNQFQVNYGDTIKTTEILSSTVEEGLLEVTTKRITDRSEKLFVGRYGSLLYKCKKYK